MARKIVHQLIDDIDGTILEVDAGETIYFALDGVAYEIDLTAENASSMREALAPYVAAGRSVSSGRGGSTSTSSKRRPGQRDYSAIRSWAKDNGYQVAERGRVPASVVEAYEAAR